MELLDKGNFHASKIKQTKKMIKFASVLCIGAPILLTVLTREIIPSFMVLFVAVFAVTIGILYFTLKQHSSKLEYIDKMTDKFDKFVITTQIISKSKETVTNVSGQNGYVSSATRHTYIVGVRTNNGSALELYSKDLFMSAREGEYIDVLVKQKLDKNEKVLDCSFTPLMDTIKQSI